MGNDGGSIPTRRELVKEAAKGLNTTQVKEVQSEQQAHAWSHDPLTRKPLARPVVSDCAGTLYNKDSIIEYILSGAVCDDDADAREKAEKDKVLQGRVKSMKDVVEVKFEIEPEGVSALVESSGSTGRKEKWVCPITNKELGPGSKAVYLVPCGHAFDGSVVREVTGEVCLQCNEPYAENDVIPILPTVAVDIARLALRMRTLREKGLTHALKKAPGSKKRKKSAEKEAVDGETVPELVSSKAKDSSSDEGYKTSTKDNKEHKEIKSKSTPTPTPTPLPSTSNNGIKNSSTASLTKKVLAEQEQRNKRRKLEQNANVQSLFSTPDATPRAGNSADYMTRGFSIPAKK